MDDTVMAKDWRYRELITSKEWTELRALKVKNNPCCEMCLKEGRWCKTQEVHHIIPIERGRTFEEMKAYAFDYHNLMSLCKEHHHKIHFEMQSHKGAKARQQALRQEELDNFFEKMYGKI